MQQIEQIVASLRDEGFRITPQRMAIVDYLLKTEDHPSAELIHKVIRKRYPMVSLSTVYKTLELLKEKKLVNEMDVEGEARFDAHTNEHINLVCMNCGKIDDVDEDSLKEIQIKAARKSKYLIL
jgi:Fur family peroxide stress response transcriptional regulator